MGRPIDADLLKTNCKITGEFMNNFECVSLATLGEIIDKQPTIEAEPAQGWISVKDRVPELNKRVFVYVTDVPKRRKLFLVGEYDGKFWFVHTPVTVLIFDTMYKVTHWMPLPEPPKRNPKCKNELLDEPLKMDGE